VVRDWLDDDATQVHRRLDGTMVFVDVSGFTSMSERLARFGKEGAEAVTEVISRCFDRLLTDAYGFGATLLKFGGDALLLFFQGEAHEARGCAAALAMRRALREIGTFATKAGRVTLRMSVGVHRGDFDFFLVGTSHRELIIAGAEASEVVALESAAGAGQILVSAAVAETLPRANVGHPRGPGRLLGGRFAIEGKELVRFREVDHDLAPYVPVALRELLAGEGGPPEHRRVTVGFVHFGGVDELIARAGPDTAASTLDALVGTLQTAIDPRRVCFLGTDIASDGGKVILTAGAPSSEGDDEERMLLALRSFMDVDLPLPVRVGVNTGPVFAGEIGTVHRRTYTVMGDAVNLAARLMARAGDGQILATEPVLRASRTLFELDTLEPFLVKGKRRPVVASVVGAPRGVRAGIAANDLPLVGRDAELAIVLDVVEALSAGKGRLLEIVAEPGVGKSRLVEEAIRRSEHLHVHRVQCRQYQVATPYFAVQGLLRELLGVTQETDTEALAELARTVRLRLPVLLPWLPLIAIPFGLEDEESEEVARLSEEFRKQQLERSVVELLSTLVTEPTLLCFEDTHWMDDASGDLVRALEAELDRRPWLICVTRRHVPTGFVPLPSPTTTTLELSTLDPTSTTGLLKAATAGEPLPDHLLQALTERSDGNPLFVLELLHALQAEDDLEALPHSIEGLIAARIDRLPAEDRTILRHVSVLGAGFWDGHIATVLPAAEGQQATTVLARLGDLLEIQPSGWVRFRHALVHDVAYAGLPFGVRSRLHGQIADSILRSATADPGDQAALLSLHFAYAQRYPEAWRFARLAGDAARELFANIEAITLYQRALQAGRHILELSTTDRAEVLERLGDVQDLAGLYQGARSSYQAARRLLADDPDRQASFFLKEAFIAERQGRYRDAVRNIRRGQRLVDGGAGEAPARLRAQLMVWLAAVRANQGKPAEAARWSRAGIGLAEAAGDEDALARAYLVLDYAASSLGESSEDNSTRALEIYERLGDLSGQATAANNLGFYAYLESRWSEAIELYGRARDARLKAGDPVNAALSEANIAEILTEQGRLDEAEELLREAAGTFAAAGDQWGVAFARRSLGAAAARAGRFDEAAETFDAARAGFSAIGASTDVVATDLSIAEGLVLAGAGREALPVLGRVLVNGEVPGGLEPYQPQLHRLWGLAALQAGELDLGQRELETAVVEARRRRATYQLALALDALDRLGRSPSGIEASEARAERDDILSGLDVIAPPVYPLPELARLD
jgi:class 3 adenylate cyclase/tetratricopeptide (TPR) repeat protein